MCYVIRRLKKICGKLRRPHEVILLMKMKADFATKKGRAESNLLRPLILIGGEFNYKQACTQKLNQLYSITQSAIFA